jgi:hypothetical protein
MDPNYLLVLAAISQVISSVLATSQVIPSRAVRAFEVEGGELSHLEVVARGAVVAPARAGV